MLDNMVCQQTQEEELDEDAQRCKSSDHYGSFRKMMLILGDIIVFIYQTFLLASCFSS